MGRGELEPRFPEPLQKEAAAAAAMLAPSHLTSASQAGTAERRRGNTRARSGDTRECDGNPRAGATEGAERSRARARLRGSSYRGGAAGRAWRLPACPAVGAVS